MPEQFHQTCSLCHGCSDSYSVPRPFYINIIISIANLVLFVNCFFANRQKKTATPAKTAQQFFQGNTAQSLCVRCVVRFFGRLPRNSAGILPYGKGFLGNMTENLHADCVQSRQAGFVRCCPRSMFSCIYQNLWQSRQAGFVRSCLMRFPCFCVPAVP